jgi:hypothetical protein
VAVDETWCVAIMDNFSHRKIVYFLFLFLGLDDDDDDDDEFICPM